MEKEEGADLVGGNREKKSKSQNKEQGGLTEGEHTAKRKDGRTKNKAKSGGEKTLSLQQEEVRSSGSDEEGDEAKGKEKMSSTNTNKKAKAKKRVLLQASSSSSSTEDEDEEAEIALVADDEDKLMDASLSPKQRELAKFIIKVQRDTKKRLSSRKEDHSSSSDGDSSDDERPSSRKETTTTQLRRGSILRVMQKKKEPIKVKDINLEVSREEFPLVMQMWIGRRIPKGTDVEAIFDLVDVDHSGHVSFHELNKWLILYQPGYVSEEERLTHIFNAYDLDRDGELHGSEWVTVRSLIKHNLLADWEREFKKQEGDELRKKKENKQLEKEKLERLEKKREQRILLQRRKLAIVRKEVEALEAAAGTKKKKKKTKALDPVVAQRLQQAADDVQQAERYKKKLERKEKRDKQLQETRETEELEKRKMRLEEARAEAEAIIEEDIHGMEMKLVDRELRNRLNYITIPKKKWIKYGLKSNLSKALLGQQLHEILQLKEKKSHRHHKTHRAYQRKRHLRHKRTQQRQRLKYMRSHPNLPHQPQDFRPHKRSLFQIGATKEAEAL